MTNPQDPYGQPNQYGQPTGQPQPYGMPPAAPQFNEPATQNIPVPTTVQASFWVWVATVVLSLVGAVVGFAGSGDALAAARSANSGLTDAQLQAIVTGTLIFAAVIAVVFAGLYLLFAFKARAGRNWARITLTVLTVLRLLALAAGVTLFGVITVVGAIVATVLLFLPESNQYFTAKKMVR
jgi:hypothetical protein